jgi:hypothetical protein
MAPVGPQAMCCTARFRCDFINANTSVVPTTLIHLPFNVNTPMTAQNVCHQAV